MQPIDRNISQWMRMPAVEEKSEESSDDSLDILIQQTENRINKITSEIEIRRLTTQENENSLQRDFKKLEIDKQKAESAHRELQRTTKTMTIGSITGLISLPISPLFGLACAGISAVGTGIALGISLAGTIISGYFIHKRAEGDECIKLIQKKFPELIFIHAERLFNKSVKNIMYKSDRTQTISHQEGVHLRHSIIKIPNNAKKSTEYVLETYKKIKISNKYSNLEDILNHIEIWSDDHDTINLH